MTRSNGAHASLSAYKCHGDPSPSHNHSDGHTTSLVLLFHIMLSLALAATVSPSSDDRMRACSSITIMNAVAWHRNVSDAVLKVVKASSSAFR